MKAILLASALLVSGLAFSSAHAAPAAPVAPLAAAPAAAELPLLTVQYRRDYRDNRRYRAGQRYRSAPQGWHRYDRRPGDWRSRRCGQVGPIWFCP